MPTLREAPHVIVVNDSGAVNGGASKVAITGAIAMAARGLEVDYLCAFGPIDAALAASGCKVLCLEQTDLIADPNPLTAGLRGWWNASARTALLRLLAGRCPGSTVVHIHTWVKSLSAAVVEAAISHRFPTVITLHDYFTACPNGGFFNYRSESACTLRPLSWRCLASDCDSRSRLHKAWRVMRQAIQQMYGGVPGQVLDFIAISPYSSRILAPYLPPGARIHQVDNPIDLERRQPSTVAANAPFAFVGRLSPEKGPMQFAKAARKAGVRVRFIGDGPCRQDLLELCPDAEITGWLPHSEVLVRLAGCRMLVFPSLWHETQGLVVQEAAALGLPALVSDACAAREAVMHGETGFIVDMKAEDGLSDRLRTLAVDDALVERLGQAAYERFWADPPSVRRHGDQLLACYRSMLDAG